MSNSLLQKEKEEKIKRYKKKIATCVRTIPQIKKKIMLLEEDIVRKQLRIVEENKKVLETLKITDVEAKEKMLSKLREKWKPEYGALPNLNKVEEKVEEKIEENEDLYTDLLESDFDVETDEDKEYYEEIRKISHLNWYNKRNREELEDTIQNCTENDIYSSFALCIFNIMSGEKNKIIQLKTTLTNREIDKQVFTTLLSNL